MAPRHERAPRSANGTITVQSDGRYPVRGRHADRQSRRYLGPRAQGASRSGPDRGRGHPSHRPSASTLRTDHPNYQFPRAQREGQGSRPDRAASGGREHRPGVRRGNPDGVRPRDVTSSDWHSEAGIRVEPVPGPSAVIAALSASGFASEGFCFLGFPPSKGAERAAWFDRFAAAPAVAPAVVFYEAPHRIETTLAEIRQRFGDLEVLLARELTKPTKS